MQTFFVNSPSNSRTVGAGQWGSPVYFNGRVYIHAEDDVMKAYQVVTNSGTTMLNTTPASTGTVMATYPGTNPTHLVQRPAERHRLGAGHQQLQQCGPAILRAYDANTLQLLYDSSQNPSDQAPGAVKFTTPTEANGSVIVGGTNSVAVYGLKSGMLGSTYRVGMPTVGGPLWATRLRRR